MEKAKPGRINVHIHGVTCINEEGEATNESKGIIIRDMSPQKASALMLRLSDAVTHDARLQAESELN